MTAIRTGLFRYIRHSEVAARLRAGWMEVADLGPVHGLWSVLMWRCDCEAAAAFDSHKDETR